MNVILSSVGSLSGFITHLLYRNTLVNQKDLSRQESRMHLYGACFAAFVLPAAVFMYAWTSFSHVHWIVPVIALTFFFWALFVIFIAIFSYLTDCYSSFASTALAAPNLTRNLSAIAFPLFFTPMLEALNIRWAGTLFGGIAIMIVPIPFLILSYERGVEYDGRPSYL
ncbi:hypothetical protein AN958_01628 [Leucoagaricus sp. SymC.cos]|nr:hypothetical protein AN958_01628 [Leucoagaricus sp. SymC.cos]